MNLTLGKMKVTIPYFTYALLWIAFSFLASELTPKENFGFAASDPETALAITKAYLWKNELLRTGLQLMVIPCAVFGALRTGQMSARALFAVATGLYLIIAIYLAWVLDRLVPPDQVHLLSIQGLLEYQYWEFRIWQWAVNSIVPVLALVAIMRLSSHSTRTP